MHPKIFIFVKIAIHSLPQ